MSIWTISIWIYPYEDNPRDMFSPALIDDDDDDDDDDH